MGAFASLCLLRAQPWGSAPRNGVMPLQHGLPASVSPILEMISMAVARLSRRSNNN